MSEHVHRPMRRSSQSGFTLTELMIALVLGLLVVLAATAMVVSSRGTYRTQDETTRLAESARFALELSNRLVRLAGFTYFGDSRYPAAAMQEADYNGWITTNDPYSMSGPQIVGANNSRPGGGTGLNGSDALVIRFYGSSVDGTNTEVNGGTPDGNVLDCAGVPVPQPAKNAIAYNQARSDNVLFVDRDVDGEPALMCTRLLYDGSGNPRTPYPQTETNVLIRGVEDFQVLFGEEIPKPNPDDDLDEQDPALVVYRTGIGGPNPVQNWENVKSVRVAMLLRTGVGARTDPEGTATTYALFGSAYPAAPDTGALFALSGMSASDRTRMRQIVQTTVYLRNRVRIYSTLQQP